MYECNLGIKFENVVRQHNNDIALKFSYENCVSYEELNSKANQLARYLLDMGIRQNDVVCISGAKHVRTYVCMIACLKIGAIYSILDDKSPITRLGKIISMCSPKALFIDSSLERTLQKIIEQFNITVINNEAKDLESKIKLYDRANSEQTNRITGENPAYIMYTSGSTGFPKGALMTHNNLLNLISWSLEQFGFSPDEVLTNVNPMYFDNSVFDFYSAVFSGACLVPFPRDVMANPAQIVKRVDELQCTSWFSVPSVLIYLDTMKLLNPTKMKYIRRFIFGGEGYPKAKLKRLYDSYGDRAELFNVYGPTECTCICSSYKIGANDFENLQGLPPLGEIVKNFSYLILANDNKPVEPDQIGELCLMGPNLGKGYYNDAERTKTSFVQNPCNDKFHQIMYKTGDFVRYNSDDNKLYFCGRKDNQIKHMGYRIELEEVEAALSCLDYISQAAVIHGNTRGLSQIIAIVSVASDSVDEKKIRTDLGEIIPDYMIPTRMYFERHLPKNPNGKVDRRRLAEKYVAESTAV